MSFKQKYTITPNYLTSGTKRRSGLLITPAVKFVVAHDTGNKNSTASQNVRYYEISVNEISASAHLFVDDTDIIECIPALTSDFPEKAWHVLYSVPVDNQLFGYNANDAAIGVEYCYGDSIDADEAYRKYIWVLAYICYKFQLNPKTSIVGHHFLDPKRKTDPVTGLAYSRRTYEQLLKDIVNEYNECLGLLPDNSFQFIPERGMVISTTRLNIRKDLPSTKAEVAQIINAGTKLSYLGYVANGENINGNRKWYKDAKGQYFWSGGVKQVIS
ncbi:MAG TPA: peptidoglycan recognition family protein [Bacteroidia bacterium]|jgi:N-acetyl-anhydromuramyl-L-alanine amidase AmpD|nr:peptidoglycan recognition family protein [Bacteroidia bacterium]